MNLPITNKELEFILEKIKHNTQLYNKLWAYQFKLKYQKGK